MILNKFWPFLDESRFKRGHIRYNSIEKVFIFFDIFRITFEFENVRFQSCVSLAQRIGVVTFTEGCAFIDHFQPRSIPRAPQKGSKLEVCRKWTPNSIFSHKIIYRSIFLGFTYYVGIWTFLFDLFTPSCFILWFPKKDQNLKYSKINTTIEFLVQMFRFY